MTKTKMLWLSFDAKEAAIILDAIATSKRGAERATLEAFKLLKEKYTRRKK